MKKTMKVNLGINLQGLANKSGNYRSIYRGSDFSNSRNTIININAFENIAQTFQNKEKITFNNPNLIIKLLDNSLKTYFQNIIQELIEHHRRRTYSNYLLFSKHNRIISYGINVQRDPDPIINEKKNKLFPQKNLKLMRTINVDKKLDLLDKYNAIKKNKKIEDISPQKEIENQSEENSENSESDFFQRNRRKKTDEIENKSIKSNNSEFNDQNDYQGILNVHQSHELTSNKLYAFKKYKMSKVELKDLIFYLEENQTIPLNKQVLYKAYIDMTIPKQDNHNQIEEDNEKNSTDKLDLPSLKFFDFIINKFYFKFFGYSGKQSLINSCNDILAQFVSIEKIVYNQMKLENLFKDYKWNNPEYETKEKNDLMLNLKGKNDNY